MRRGFNPKRLIFYTTYIHNVDNAMSKKKKFEVIYVHINNY
jgi:hypothetical protein